MWHRKAMDKEIVKAMATKFSEIFAISMLKKHRKFCRRGLTHLDATPTFKNGPNTYGPPCTFPNLMVKARTANVGKGNVSFLCDVHHAPQCILIVLLVMHVYM